MKAEGGGVNIGGALHTRTRHPPNAAWTHPRVEHNDDITPIVEATVSIYRTILDRLSHVIMCCLAYPTLTLYMYIDTSGFPDSLHASCGDYLEFKNLPTRVVAA